MAIIGGFVCAVGMMVYGTILGVLPCQNSGCGFKNE